MLMLFSISTIHAQNKIAIGYAFKYLDGECGQFTTAVGYRYDTSTGDATSMGVLRKNVSDDLVEKFSVNSNNIQLWADQKDFGCIISYQKKVSGWNCTTFNYAVGFGDTQYEAEQNAIKQMRTNYNGSEYKVETYINR